jgi:hypothetical protein
MVMWFPKVRKQAFFVSLLLFLGAVAAAVTAARPPEPPDEGELARAARKILNDREELSKKLIAVAEDAKRPEAERWQAVVALGQLGARAGLEYLVDHISLHLSPPALVDGEEDQGKDRVCFWVLMHHPAGWEGDGRNWNISQIVLRAVGKPRTKDELAAYAEVLELSLGATRYSDGTYSTSPRGLAIVEAEIASETVKTPRADFNDGGRPTRVENLKAIRKFLAGNAK